MAKEGKLAKYFKEENIKAIKYYSKDKETVIKWKEFLSKLDKSGDAYAMSLNKYKCRMVLFSNKYIVLRNLYCMLDLIKISFIDILKSIFNKNKDFVEEQKSVDMVIQIRDDLPITDVFPESLYKEFPNYEEVKASFEKTTIQNKALKEAYKKLSRKNFFRFHYRYLARREFALHSYIIEKYNPKMLAVYINERNVFSPILKEVYENEKREIINFMHGTNVFAIQNAFMSFSRLYIWDKGYIDMFENDLFCNIGKYEVYLPGKLQYNLKLRDKYDKDLTYYLSGQEVNSQKVLFDIAQKLRAQNIKLYIRPHPRVAMPEGVYPEDEETYNKYIEATSKDLKESIEQSEYIVGMNSTVLEQAYYANKKILVDDVTSKTEFESLKSRKYLMINKIYDDKETTIDFLSTYLKKHGINLDV